MQKRPKGQVDLESLTQQNIETIARIEQAAHATRTRSDVVADAIAGFCGRPSFVWVHIIWYGSWLTFNSVHTVSKTLQFDPPPFSKLTVIVSLEAIFLSAFILISQNRQLRIAEQRNHLELQINLLAEQEASQMLTMLRQVMDHLGISVGESSSLEEMTDPEKLVEQIGKTFENNTEAPPEPSENESNGPADA